MDVLTILRTYSKLNILRTVSEAAPSSNLSPAGRTDEIIYPRNISNQYTILIHAIDTLYHYTLSIHSINISYQYTFSYTYHRLFYAPSYTPNQPFTLSHSITSYLSRTGLAGVIDVTLCMTVTTLAQGSSSSTLPPSPPIQKPTSKNPLMKSEKQHILSDSFNGNSKGVHPPTTTATATATATASTTSILTADCTSSPSPSPESSSKGVTESTKGLALTASFRQQKPYVDSHPDIERHIGSTPSSSTPRTHLCSTTHYPYPNNPQSPFTLTLSPNLSLFLPGRKYCVVMDGIFTYMPESVVAVGVTRAVGKL